MDILRKYKPDYTPRSGFAWPIAETTQEKTGEASKKQADDSANTASLPDAELVKKLEKEKSLTHPKKQQNTTLLLNAMRTTAAHPFRTFHEREAATATAAGLSDVVAASEGQRSSATPVPAPITSQPAGSQTSGPSASQDSAKSIVVGTAKRKKKRMCISLNSNIATYL